MTKIIHMVVGSDYDAQTIDSLWFNKQDAESRLATVKTLKTDHYKYFTWFLEEYETEDDPRVPTPKNPLLHDPRLRKALRSAEGREAKGQVLREWETEIGRDTFLSLADRAFAGRVVYRLLRIVVNDARREAGMSTEGDWK